jgi:hypothetical protein
MWDLAFLRASSVEDFLREFYVPPTFQACIRSASDLDLNIVKTFRVNQEFPQNLLLLCLLETKFHTHVKLREQYPFCISVFMFHVPDEKVGGCEVIENKHYPKWMYCQFPCFSGKNVGEYLRTFQIKAEIVN